MWKDLGAGRSETQRRRAGQRSRANGHAGRRAGTGLGGGRLGQPGTSAAGRRALGGTEMARPRLEKRNDGQSVPSNRVPSKCAGQANELTAVASAGAQAPAHLLAGCGWGREQGARRGTARRYRRRAVELRPAALAASGSGDRGSGPRRLRLEDDSGAAGTGALIASPDRQLSVVGAGGGARALWVMPGPEQGRRDLWPARRWRGAQGWAGARPACPGAWGTELAGGERGPATGWRGAQASFFFLDPCV